MKQRRQNKTIRLFISSTFSDMEIEREALQNAVFPKLSSYCQNKGWYFDAIDLRWGVSTEAALDQKTMQICLSELKECQLDSPRPNFLILLGDRYGWIPLPEKIPFAHANNIISLASHSEKELFEEWYCLDTNQLPFGEYLLQSRGGEYRNYDYYCNNVEMPLRLLFKRFAATIGDVKDRIVYERSATEQEIHKGAFEVLDAGKHVVAYLREFDSKIDLPTRYKDIEPENISSVAYLKSQIREYVSKDNIIENSCDIESYNSDEYRAHFAESIYDSMIKVIDNEIESYNQIDKLEQEKSLHQTFADQRTKCFIGRGRELSIISSYISNNDNKPLEIKGSSGSGKSSLLARAIQTITEGNENIDIIVRFLGTTPSTSYGDGVLRSIWEQLCNIYKIQEDFSIRNLSERLKSLKTDRPLIIALDAIDQLDINDSFNQFAWLPLSLPENVYIIYTILDRPEYNDIIPAGGISSKSFAVNPIDIAEAYEIIKINLKQRERQLTVEQWGLLYDLLSTSELTPIYIHLLSVEVSKWHSYENNFHLPNTTEKFILHLFEKLSLPQNHGQDIVKLALSILACSRIGVSHSEMREILASDDMYWQSILDGSQHNIGGQNRILPVAIWSRLYNDLKDYLCQVSLHDSILITFYHRQIREAVDKFVLCDIELQNRVLGLLTDYYESKWRGGDIHSLYELPYQLSKAGDVKSLQALYESLYFLYLKCKLGVSRELISDYQLILILVNSVSHIVDNDKYANTLFEIRDLEVRLSVQRNNLKTFDDVLHYAAMYEKGSAIHNLFLDQTNYSSMVDILGLRSRDNRFERVLNISAHPSMALSDDGMRIISLNENEQLYTYNIETEHIEIFPSLIGVRLFKVSSDFKIIVGVDIRGIFRYNIDTTVKEYIPHRNNIDIISLFISADARVIVSQCKSSAVDRCELILAFENTSIRATFYDSYTLVDLSPNGVYIALNKIEFINEANPQNNDLYRKYKDNLILYTISKDSVEVFRRVAPESSYRRNFMSSSMSYDGMAWAWATGSSVCVYNLNNNTVICFGGHNTLMRGRDNYIHMNHNGSKMLSYDNDGTLLIYDIENSKLLSRTSLPNSVFLNFSGASVGKGDNRTISNVPLSHIIRLRKGLSPMLYNVGAIGKYNNFWPDGITHISVDAKGQIVAYTAGEWEHSDSTDNHCHLLSIARNNTQIYPSIIDTYDLSPNDSENADKGYYRTATGAQVSSNGNYIVYAVGNSAFVYNTITKKTKEYYFKESQQFLSITLSRDSRYLVVGLSGQTKIVIIRLSDSKERHISLSNYIKFNDLSISMDNKYIIIEAYLPGWYLINLTFTAAGLTEYCTPAEELTFTPFAHIIFTNTPKYKKTNKKYNSLVNISSGESVLCSRIMAISHSHLMYCALNNNEVLCVYKQSQLVRTLPAFSSVNCVLFTYDDLHLYICSGSSIYLYNIEKDRVIDSFHNLQGSSKRIKLYGRGVMYGNSLLEPSTGNIINYESIVSIMKTYDLIENKTHNEISICPICGEVFEPNKDIISAVKNIMQHIGADPIIETYDPFCNYAYNSANAHYWEDDRLRSECPNCNAKLKFNPFIATDEERSNIQREQVNTNIKIQRMLSKPMLNTTPLCFTQMDYINMGSPEHLVIPSTITHIADKAFADCTSLKSIELPDSIVSIGDIAFYRCTSLKTIILPSSVSQLGSAIFYGCKELRDIIILSELLIHIPDSFCMSCGELRSIKLPYNTEIIEDNAFAMCRKLKSVNLPKTLRMIGQRAFYDCRSLESIILPTNLTYIGTSAFSLCYGITNLVIPKSVQHLGESVLSNMPSLNTLTISNPATNIHIAALDACNNIKQIFIPQGSNYLKNQLMKMNHIAMIIEIECTE